MENNNQPKQEQLPLEEVLELEISKNGGEWKNDKNSEGRDGTTMFDLPNSEDNLVTVLLPREKIRSIGAHSILEIRSRTKENGGDGRTYRGIVVAGPFHEPDGIRGDAPMMISTTIHGGIFMPNFHGKVMVELIGELKGDVMMPPRFRPLPNSPVFVLDKDATADALKVHADPGITLGMAIGHDDIEVQYPSNKKTVIPRHIGILGTTGGGKSTTVSGIMAQYQKEGIATVVIDTEGEYTNVDKQTEDVTMKKLSEQRGIEQKGIDNLKVYHLVGRNTRAKSPTQTAEFTLNFSSLSPYSAADILGLTEAQFGRFFKAYDVAKLILKDTRVFPEKGKEADTIEINEFDTGWPKVTLSLLIDIAGLFYAKVSETEANPYNHLVKTNRDIVNRRIEAVKTDHEQSWLALLSKLWQLKRTEVFDKEGAKPIPFDELIEPGKMSIIDLSDSDSTVINNIVIANILRGIQMQQEKAYELAVSDGREPTPVSIIIEEAHEFLSKDKISKMANLYEQVARISRRGRKRWLGLVFVTQLPQHLPDEVLGLINSFILHKINDANVVSRLKRSIGGVDSGLWNKLPNLAPGQAIVSMPSLTRPLLVALDPTPCKLLMVD